MDFQWIVECFCVPNTKHALGIQRQQITKIAILPLYPFFSIFKLVLFFIKLYDGFDSLYPINRKHRTTHILRVHLQYMTRVSFESSLIRVFIFCLRWLIILLTVSSGGGQNSQVRRSLGTKCSLLSEINHVALELCDLE